jgi:hypothetical protein
MTLNLKATGFPKLTAKLVSITKAPKISKVTSFKFPKSPVIKGPKDFNFAKATKINKLPAPKKVSILKKAVKKSAYGIKL